MTNTAEKLDQIETDRHGRIITRCWCETQGTPGCCGSLVCWERAEERDRLNQALHKDS